MEKAIIDGLNTIDDWWALPMVKQKKEEYEQEMKKQLQLEEYEDRMMDIYSHVEKRPNNTGTER